MSMTKRFLYVNFLVAIVMCSLFTNGIYAQVGTANTEKPLAEEMIGSNGITWLPKVDYVQMIITIAKPDGTVFNKTFNGGAAPSISSSDLQGTGFIDGGYTYELRVVSDVRKRNINDDVIDNSKSPEYDRTKDYPTQSGHFTVKGGMIVSSNIVEPNGVGRGSISTSQDNLSTTSGQVFTTDLIVIGSTCIGVDCTSSESFGFDTLRFKENNLRIKFQDTSNSGSFPTRDWQLIANDSTNGGEEYFAIFDQDSGRYTFKLRGGTRANAIYVDSSGRVGLGTSTPSEDLHIWYGDTPTIRLDQSGSGWAPQMWDISGNETNFFIRDVTHSSNLPFRIRTTAPHNSLYIDTDGDVGLGTQSPSASLHIKEGTDTTGIYLETDEGTNAMVIVERPDGARNFMSASAQHGFFGTESEHPLRFNVNNSWRMEIKTDNSLLMKSGASCTAGGVWTSVSSRKAKENIKNLNTDEAIDTLKGLTPVKYNYKVEKDEDYVGFIAEDVPELVATKDRKGLTAMDIVAVLTKVVQEQQKTIDQLKKEVAELKKNK